MKWTEIDKNGQPEWAGLNHNSNWNVLTSSPFQLKDRNGKSQPFQPKRNGMNYSGVDPNNHLGLGKTQKIQVGFGSGPRIFHVEPDQIFQMGFGSGPKPNGQLSPNPCM